MKIYDRLMDSAQKRNDASFDDMLRAGTAGGCAAPQAELAKEQADFTRLRFRPGTSIGRNMRRIETARDALKQCRDNPAEFRKTSASPLGIRAFWPSVYDYLFGN